MPSFFMQKNSQGTGDGWSLFPDMREKLKFRFLTIQIVRRTLIYVEIQPV